MDSCKGTADIKKVILKESKYLVIPAIVLIGLFVFGDSITSFEVLAQLDNTNIDQESTNNSKTHNNQVPAIIVTSDDLEIEMDPLVHMQENNTIKLGLVNTYETRSNKPEITIKQGDIISLTYEKEPVETKVYLVNYDTDDKNEIYSVQQVDDAEFEIPDDGPEGLTNLEIRSLFDNNERIIYTTSVFIEPEVNQLTSPTEDYNENNDEEVEEDDEEVEEDDEEVEEDDEEA